MGKKKIKIHIKKKKKIEKELETDNLLKDIREQLLKDKVIDIPFIFLKEDEEGEEISKEEESKIQLKDILDGKNLYLKLEKITRKMLGHKIETKNGMDWYVYPQKDFDYYNKQRSSNIMVVGETGVGKSTWLHCFINYLQGIQIEENNRYYLFDEKKLQEEYKKEKENEELYGKKTSASSVTDKPSIYNVEPTSRFPNPIRLIDTAGFGDSRGEKYDEKITKDMKELFTNKIDTIQAICLIFKSSDNRAHERSKAILDKLFNLFGKEVKDNIIIMFTFVDDYNIIPAFQVLKDEKSPFYNILGPIDNLPYFKFNNNAYLTNDKELAETFYEKNTQNFEKLLKHVFSLKQISLESTRKVCQDRFEIENYIDSICNNKLDKVIHELKNILNKKDEVKKKIEQKEKLKESPYKRITVRKKREVQVDEDYKDYFSSGWYNLYCNSCNEICHDNCKGPREGFHSNEYGCRVIGTFSCKCSNCKSHYSKHEFRNYKWKTRKVPKMQSYEEEEDDPNSVLDEKGKKEKRDQIDREIKEKEEEIRELDKKIKNLLNESIDELSKIASKGKELKKIALKSDDNDTNEYAKEVLKRKIEDNKIKEIFIKTLNNIESVCSHRESSIRELKETLEKC
jgi:GTP-binding protein EngB required for normal cell division